MGSLIDLVRAAHANQDLTAFERSLLKLGKMLILAFALSALPVLLPAVSAQSFNAAQWGTAIHTAVATGTMAVLASLWKYLSASAEDAQSLADKAQQTLAAAAEKSAATQAALDQAKALHAQSVALAQQSGVVPVVPEKSTIQGTVQAVAVQAGAGGVGADAAVAVSQNVGAAGGAQEGEPAATNPATPAVGVAPVADSIPESEPITAASMPAVTEHLPIVDTVPTMPAVAAVRVPAPAPADVADAATVKVTAAQKDMVAALLGDEQPTAVLPVELVRQARPLDSSNPAL